MENASKALILAGEVLIGVILLTLMVFMFRAMGDFSNAVDDNIKTKNLSEFNANLEKYIAKEDITAQDIVSLGNFAREYNAQMESVQLEIIIQNIPAYRFVHTLDEEKTYRFIKEYATKKVNEVDEIRHFTCEKKTYNKDTGRINRIELKESK